jgi:hypothetical protein
MTEEEQERFENIANEIDDILFVQFKSAWERIQADIDSLPLADIKFLTSIPSWQVEIEELVGITGPIAFIDECIELSLSRPNCADPYAAQGWIYGIPEQDGCYWMMGYTWKGLTSKPGTWSWRNEFYESPVMVSVEGGYVIVHRGQGRHHHSIEDLTAVFLPILEPVIDWGKTETVK